MAMKQHKIALMNARMARAQSTHQPRLMWFTGNAIATSAQWRLLHNTGNSLYFPS
jgi:hypothetical protein